MQIFPYKDIKTIFAITDVFRFITENSLQKQKNKKNKNKKQKTKKQIQKPKWFYLFVSKKQQRIVFHTVS